MRKQKGDQGGGGGGGSKVGRWLGAPVRALTRACDSYVRKMSACAGRMPTQYAGAVGGRGAPGPGFMQAASFSSRSTRRRGGGEGGDVGELVRAMSERPQQQGRRADVVVPPRSWSVAAGRIDEDAPCEFGGGADGGSGTALPSATVRRSRSVAVGGTGAGAGAGAALPPLPRGFRPTKKLQQGVVGVAVVNGS